MDFSSSAFNRRAFAGTTAALAAVAVPGLLPQAAMAQARVAPQAGKDYMVLDKSVAVETPPGKIEVVEFFWYNCPHCNAFEPAFEKWAKAVPADVVVRRMPVSFRDDFLPQQKLYYTLEAMGKVDELHVKVFTAIHGEHQQIATDGAIINWAAKQGLDKAKFTETFNSFSVNAKARRATQMQNAYKVEGVPALGVAGRFYTDGQLAGNMDRALQTTDFLIGLARKGA
ncbi:thioredoxin domain-containing protein [Xylophilus sp. Kf1]|nr:thioredoxin domain-containing protein [Xylophilus sp. Kf1]